MKVSPPARGAWIEIDDWEKYPLCMESPPARGAWIEIVMIVSSQLDRRLSPPARGAWIEISVTE